MGARRLFRKIESLLQKYLAMHVGKTHGSTDFMTLRRAEFSLPLHRA